MALVFLFLVVMLFTTTSEGWVYIGYPVYFSEGMVIFCMGVFGWLCVMCMNVFYFAKSFLILLNSVGDWGKLL